MNQPNEVPQMWRGYRRVKRRLIVLALGWIPFGVLVGKISSINQGFEYISFLIVLYALFLFFTLVQFQLIRCPNCGVRLHFRRSRGKCGGCGIRINSDSETATYHPNPAKMEGWAPESYFDWLRRRWKYPLVASIATFVSIGLLVALSVSLSIRSTDRRMRGSDVTKLTIATAAANTALTNELGVPLKTEELITGYVSTNAGNAQVIIPVSGPRGSGVLYARLLRQGNTWQMQSLIFREKGIAVNLDLLAIQDQKSKTPPE